MKLYKFNRRTKRYKPVELSGTRIEKADENGFSVYFNVGPHTHCLTLSPQECDDWLSEFGIAAKQVEG